MYGHTKVQGALSARHMRPRGPGLAWRMRNGLRWGYIKGWIARHIIMALARWWGLMTGIGDLSIRLRRADGTWIDYGTVSYRVVTDAGVAMIVDDLDNNAADISTLNYHGCGTGTTAEAAGDTALITESTTILNPDSTRATGTRSQPAANQFRSVGTVTFDGSGAITEHGLFSESWANNGTLLDRSVFSAINVASGDSIQFTYTLTLTAGG